MFERFTDGAKRVLVLAQEEARRLDHAYIGTEHLLLGLLHGDDGVGSRVLRSVGLSLSAARRSIEEAIGRGETTPTGHVPFTPRVKRILELSVQEANQLEHDHIGTEHLLLGLLREGEGVGAQLVVRAGPSLDDVRQRVLVLLSDGPDHPHRLAGPAGDVAGPAEPASTGAAGSWNVFRRFTAGARRVVVLAGEAARDLHHHHIGTEHLLLGLVQEGDGVAARALASSGITGEAVGRQVEEAIGRGASPSPGHLPFTPRAKAVLELAPPVADQLGHGDVDTRHLLLGLLDQSDGVGARVLETLGVDLADLRRRLIG